MAGLLAVFASFEREILGERTRVGLAHARQNGKRLGRPATAAVHTAEIRKLHRAGVSKSEIARRLQVGRTSVRRILASYSSQKKASAFSYAGLPKSHLCSSRATRIIAIGFDPPSALRLNSTTVALGWFLS
jgi:DNA invertase Pin-like site-specific DNA recombinase